MPKDKRQSVGVGEKKGGNQGQRLVRAYLRSDPRVKVVTSSEAVHLLVDRGKAIGKGSPGEYFSISLQSFNRQMNDMGFSVCSASSGKKGWCYFSHRSLVDETPAGLEKFAKGLKKKMAGARDHRCPCKGNATPMNTMTMVMTANESPATTDATIAGSSSSSMTPMSCIAFAGCNGNPSATESLDDHWVTDAHISTGPTPTSFNSASVDGNRNGTPDIIRFSRDANNSSISNSRSNSELDKDWGSSLVAVVPPGVWGVPTGPGSLQSYAGMTANALSSDPSHAHACVLPSNKGVNNDYNNNNNNNNDDNDNDCGMDREVVMIEDEEEVSAFCDSVFKEEFGVENKLNN